MYKLIIADDEKIIRMGLKNVVDWESLGFEITQIFADGQEILEYLDYMIPDVILTDIKMSQVSGLDVAKYVFEHKIPCKVVLISGYQEFELAVQGLKYGAEDYLLKPTNVADIEETFTKIKKQLDILKEDWERERVERERMDEAIPLLEERFFADLILGGVIDSREYIRSRIHIIYPDLDVDNSQGILVDIIIRDFEHFMSDIWEYSYDQLETNLKNFFRIYNNQFFFHIVYKSGCIVEIVGIRTGQKLQKEDCQQAMKALVEELEQSFHFQVDFEIRCVYDSVLDIGRLKEDTGRTWDEKEKKGYIAEQKKLIMSNISVGNIIMAQKLFHNILEELGMGNIIERNNIVIDIFSTMNGLLSEINEELSQSLQTYFNYSLLASMEKTEEVLTYCDRIFDRIKMAEEKKEYYHTDSLINKAKAYIQENLYRDVSQEEIANRLFICSSYLSRLFKKQTGENFTQYVTRVKMDRAIELLKDPQYKTYQVSEALGYKTPRYFSRLFRMQTGMNPSEYRGKVLHLGGGFDEA